MATTTIVLLSDIHIGSNTRTNWYQRDVHEPYLLAVFDHVKANAAAISELVILGDLVDQWTYLPGERPPSLDDIFAANPAIFGGVVNGQPARGALAEAVTALAGRVSYLPGNHDMAMTADDMARFADTEGHSIQFPAGPTYEPPAGQGRIVCTHGHIYSMFNAPDFTGDPARGLPLGHYVTRLSAMHAMSVLGPDQTVADLPVSGDPTGTALLKNAFTSMLQSFHTGNASLSQIVMGTFLDAAGATPDLEFVLLDGTRIRADAIAPAYDKLYDEWKEEARFPRAIYGRDPALPALSLTDARNSLGYFAAVLGARYRVVVMGHTHVPEDDDSRPVLIGRSVYANPGFNCPSKPDMTDAKQPGRVTFTEIEIDDTAGTFAVATRYVTGGDDGVRVAPEPLSPARVVPIH